MEFWKGILSNENDCFSHSDKIPELADGVNSLLSPKENLVPYGEEDQNLLQRGKDILGDTLDTINENVKNFKHRVNKKSSGCHSRHFSDNFTFNPSDSGLKSARLTSAHLNNLFGIPFV